MTTPDSTALEDRSLAGLAEGFPSFTPEASVLLAYSLDAVTEVLEWANDGVGADPAACTWLATLRMAERLGLQTSPSAPAQLKRPVDVDLDAALPQLRVTAESFRAAFPQLTASLASDRMGTRSHPLTEAELPSGQTDCSHVLRGLPLALIEHLEPETIYSLALESVAISVSGVAEQHQSAALIATLASALTSAEPEDIIRTETLAASLGTPLARGEAESSLERGRLLNTVGSAALASVVGLRLAEAHSDDDDAARARALLVSPAFERLEKAVNPRTV